MPGPSAERITVRARQRRVLERIIRRETSSQQQVRRAKIILMAADGANNEQVGRQVHVTEDTARLWRQRWGMADEALQAAEVEGDDRTLEGIVVGVLADDPRSGAPTTFTPEQICQIVALACEPPEASGRPIDRWMSRELADEAAKRRIVAHISPQSVERFLKGRRFAAASKPVLADAGAR